MTKIASKQKNKKPSTVSILEFECAVRQNVVLFELDLKYALWFFNLF